MQKIVFVKPSVYMGKLRLEGEEFEVENNDAFGLIEKGVAKIYKSPRDKMMQPSKSKGYKIK